MSNLAWYPLAICAWIIVLPVTGITASSLLLGGVVSVLAGVAHCVAELLGYDATIVALGTLHPGPWVALVLATLIGVVLFMIGWALWRLTTALYRLLMAAKPQSV